MYKFVQKWILEGNRELAYLSGESEELYGIFFVECPNTSSYSYEIHVLSV